MTDVLIAAVAVASGGYALVGAAMAWLIARAAPAPAPLDDADLPDVVVAVAARDEEGTIARCLDALLAQDYPAERLTIVVADDHSADRTAAVVQRYVARYAAQPALAGFDDEAPEVPDVRYLRVPDPAGDLRGKAQALHTAIAATRAPLVLVTDADCAPPPGWVRAKVAHFADSDVGIVCGMSRIAPRPDRPFDRAQALDWAFMVGATGALAEAGLPATGMGNNMAVRRAAYDGVGGYPALPFSVTEDFTLVRAVAEARREGGGRWRIRIPLNAATTVWTLPAEGLAHAYEQRRRWARGGLDGGPPVWATYVGLHAAHLLPVVALTVAPLAGVAAILAMAGANALLLAATLRRTGPPLRAADLVGFEAFQRLYLLTLPLVLLLRPRVGWKGRRH